MGFKLLIIGSNQKLQSVLLNALEEQPYSVASLPSVDDIGGSDPSKISEYFAKSRPSLLMLLSDPNLEPPEFVDSLELVLAVCAERNTPVIAVSSHQVFEGSGADEGFVELDTPNSSSKLSSAWCDYERLISQLNDHIILRFSWLIDGERSSLIDRLAPLLIGDDSQQLTLTSKSVFTPVTQKTAVNALLAIIQQVLCGAENWGLFHLSSSDTATEHDFASRLAGSIAEYEVCVRGIAEVDVDTDPVALLMGSAYLKGERLTQCFGIQQVSWRSGFGIVVKSYLDGR